MTEKTMLSNLSRQITQSLVLLVIAWLLVFFCYAETWQSMLHIWYNSSTYQHCFLIPIISAYLILQKCKQLKSNLVSFDWIALVVIFFASLLWSIATALGIQLGQHIMVVSLLIGSAWFCLGRLITKLLLFPLLYLYFAVPFGDFLIPYLQDFTAQFAVYALRLSGLPVLLEDRLISLPSGDFLVAEACSGVNYLIASVAIGALFAHLHYRCWWRVIGFMLLAVGLPIVANAIRAYGIIMLAHVSDLKLAIGVDHLIYGWLFFAVVLLALFSLGRLFSENIKQHERVLSKSTTYGAGATVLVSAILFAALLLGPILQSQFYSQALSDKHYALTNQQPWQPAENNLGTRFLKASQQQLRHYQNITAYLFDYSQSQSELVNAQHRFFDAKHWQRAQAEVVYDEKGSYWRFLLNNKQGQHYIVFAAYQVGDSYTHRGWQVKLWQMLHFMRGQVQPKSAWVIYYPAEPARKVDLKSYLPMVQGLN